MVIKNTRRAGFSLIEASISLVVVAMMIVIIGSLMSTRDANRRIAFRAQAAALADEQINALRRTGFGNLADQTAGAFKSVLYNAGTWRVIADASVGHSAPNVLELAGNAAVGNAVSGRLIWPAGQYASASLETKMNIRSDSPAGASAGLLLQAQDSANGYRLRIAPTGTDLDTGTSGTQNIWLEKVTAGTGAGLWSAASTVTISSNAWFTLRVELTPAANPTIRVYLNGNQQDSGTITDNIFSSGHVAFLGWRGVHLWADDVQTVVDGVTSGWTFDGSLDWPAAWVRLGLNDLPDATPNVFDDNGLLTLAPYPQPATTNLKQVTVRVEWRDRGQTASYTSTSLIGKSELGL